MSYNILSKNVQFQGATQGTIEDMVDDHSNQTINGQKTFSNLSASSDVSVVGNISASLNISASNFYANGVLVDPSAAGAVSAVANGADNRIATFSSADALNGEASLTFDGSTKTLEIATSGDPTGIVNLYGTLSGSGNISGSAFYGDGSNLDNVNAETVTLAAGSGLQNSSGLLVDPSQSTAIAGSINDSDSVTVYSTADSAPRKVTVADIAGRATVPISTYTNTGGNANRVVVSIDGSGVVARTNLTFDNSDLLLTGNMSGSGNLQLGGTIRMDGMTSLADPIQVTNDEIVLIDDTNNLVSKVSFSSFCGAIGGDGLIDNSGRLDVQVSGAVKIASDKVGISGSIAGNGLGYQGGVDSISALEVNVSDFMSNGANNRILTAADANTMNAEANFTFDGATLELTGAFNMSGSATFDVADFTITSDDVSKPILLAKDIADDINSATYLKFSKLPSSATYVGDGKSIGIFQWTSLRSNNTENTYAQLFARIWDDTVGVHSGKFDFQVWSGGSSEILLSVQGARSGSLPCEVIVNEDGADCNFRVESDTNTHAFFIDGTDGHVGVGGEADSGSLLFLTGSNDEYLFQVKQQGNGYPTMFLAGENHATYPGVFYNRGTFVNGGPISQGNLAGENGSHTRLTVRKTSIADNTATDIITFTVPNANHAASIRVTGLANFDGCGYAKVFSYEGVIARASGSPTDKAFSSVTTTESAGITPNFTVAVAGSSNTGANTAQQTFTMQLTIDTSDSSTSNATIMIELINFNDSGITMAAS